MPTFGKSAPLRDAALAEFLTFYGEQSDGSDRKNLAASGPGARFREFSREDIASRDDDLDIVWLKDAGASPEDDLTDPAAIAAAMSGHLRLAITALDEIAESLRQTVAEERDD